MNGDGAPDPADLVAARAALAAIGRRAEVARRLELGSAEAVLRSIVEAAVLLFEAEAASLALFDAARNVLVFRVAAGAQGQGVVGLEIPPDRGLVGYVFSTGQALAISDVARDPRFGRAFAEQTQYVPRSIVAVPLVDDHGTIGVLEVLDKRTEATFSIRDVELAGAFARQASVAIRASRVERDLAAMISTVLGLAGGARGAARRRRRAGRRRRRRHRRPRRPALAARRADRGAAPSLARAAGARHRAPGGARPAGRARCRCPRLRARPEAAPPRVRAMSEEALLPAWSEPFVGARVADLRRDSPFGRPTRDWAIGGTDGSGVTVAIIDSGVERDHPAVGGRLIRSVKVELAPDPEDDPVVLDDPAGLDVVGHGTACAGIIHALAPGADLVSVRVLGPDNRGKGIVFAAGLDWAIEQGATVVNLSLSSKSDALFGLFHDLADRAYFANVLLVCAANNVPGNSYPSLFASVVSVAAHDLADPGAWFYNPDPPVEFGAHGVDVEVAWRDGGRMIATGNSFAAPHIAGYAALIRAAHPEASPFEVKAILAATASEPPRR